MGSYDIGANVKKVRLSQNVTQEVLANELGISRQRVIRIEKGQTDPSFKILGRIADILNIDLNTLTEKRTSSKGLNVLYREKTGGEDETKGVETIEKLLKTMFAHEKLYFETHEEDSHDDLY